MWLFGCATESIDPDLANLRMMPSMVCDSNAINRREVRARHIIIVPLSKDDEGLLAAYNKTAIIRNKLLEGKDFTQMAKEYSDGPSATYGGDLGFFKRGVMVEEFENVAFCLPVGELSPVFPTIFGYHVVEVTDYRN